MNKHLRVKLSIFLIALAISLAASSSALGQATIVILNNDAPGVGFNDTTPVAPVGGNDGTTLGQQRLNAFELAAIIWGAALNSGPTITVRASWDSTLPCTATTATLGSASTLTLRQNFANAPFTGTWYPSALGNALSGIDSNTANPEIGARFNPRIGTSGCLQSRQWYLGLDGNEGSGIDLVSVLLHEFGHGLGFADFTDPETGNFVGTSPGFPSVWDRFLRDNSTGKLWVDMTSAERVASAINTGNLVWGGPEVTAAAPGVLSSGTDSSHRVRMFAPSQLDPGSSVSHFDTAAFPNLLMEPNITAGLNHTVGPPSDLTVTLLREIGWNVTGSVPTPSPTPIPAPPPNDAFAAAQVISGCAGSVNGTNAGATREAGEQNHSPDGRGGAHSIWYRWEAPASGVATIDTIGSGFDTVLAAYMESSLGSLSVGFKNDDIDPGVVTSSRLSFPATAGTIYRIAVDGFNSGGDGEVGPVKLNWSVSNCSGFWSPMALASNQAELRSWTMQGRTSIYVKLTFPDAGYRVVNWGTPVPSGNGFIVDTTVQRFTGVSAQAVSNTAQIWDLGPLGAGSYTFSFMNSGSLVRTLNFTVSATAPPPNPIDDAREFVRWQYKDFLRREPDGPGWDHWTFEITQCSDPAFRLAGEDQAKCVDRKRDNTSAAFFLSPEFQNTGYFVLRVYRGALGRMPHFGGSGGATDEFTRDAATVSQGIVVNNALEPNVINANKQAFVNQFVTRGDFRAIYDGLSNTAYVDRLFQMTGVAPSSADRLALINGLNGGSETRATVLFKIVDGTNTVSDGHLEFNTVYGKAFYDSLFNAAFVQMEYFGYLQRDPDPDGYAFWLAKLNFFNDWQTAEMVRAFIVSPEYRSRFGAP